MPVQFKAFPSFIMQFPKLPNSNYLKLTFKIDQLLTF